MYKLFDNRLNQSVITAGSIVSYCNEKIQIFLVIFSHDFLTLPHKIMDFLPHKILGNIDTV